MFDIKVIQEAKDMVNELAAAGALEHTHSAYRFNQWNREHPNAVDFVFTVSSGCFKIVIIPEDADFVIKTAITGSWCRDEEDSIEQQHKHLNGPFAEYEQWHNICGSEFEDCFLETAYLMTIGEHEFFIQPKAECDDYAITESLMSFIDHDDFEDEEQLEEYVEYDYETSELLCSLWGEEKGWALYNYLEEMDITDMHRGNIAFYNRSPVIIDYAS